MQTIILISGKRQSGKSSLRNYIIGKTVVDAGVWPTFNLSTKGELMVKTDKDYMEILDLSQRNPGFFSYAEQYIWPYAKNYSNADALKGIAIDMFDLSYEQCFGTNEDKETETSIRWSDISFALPPRVVGKIKKDGLFNHFLTAREFMEEFGKIMRNINSKAWVNKLYNDIVFEQYPYVIVDDIRYPNELELFKNKPDMKVITIRLKRNPYPSDSDAETALDNTPDSAFDIVIDNSNMSLKEKTEAAITELNKWNG